MLLFALVATSSCERNCTSCDASPTVPVNQTPVATELTVTVAEDSSVDITLAGTDADGTIMDHAVATSPDNGTLTGTAPDLQYTPDADFNGADSFTFTVTDDAGAVSAPARVSIEVTPVNDAPVAMSQSVAVDEDGAVAIVLAGSDVDGDIVAYQITGAPRHGTLGGDAPSLIYMPEVDYNGPDSFTFTVTDDAGAVSAPARVSIEVTPVNDAPVAMSQSVAVDEDGAVAIVLAGSDVDGDIVAYQVTGPPRHGTLGGDAPSLIYMPEVDYNGPDSFTFTVTDDAGAVSAPARVSIEVTPVNDAPVAMSQSVAVDEDGAVAIVLAGSDVDGDIVAYQVTAPPRHGTLGGDAPSLTYMPEVDYNGPDSFTFTVTDDAGAVSAPARVSIEVTPVNDAPVAMSQSVAVDEDGTVAIVLAGSDVDGDIVAYQVTDPPGHGTLGGDAPSLTYMPEVDYNGPDSFTFTVTDGDGTVSTPADVSITVTPVNDAPVAMSQSVAVDEDGAVAIVLAGSDVDGDIVAYQVTDPPRHGTLGGDAPSLTYMPEADYNGPDSFTFTVTDGDGTVSTPADVSITVTPVNDAPTALAQTVAVASGQAIDIVLEGTDVDGTVDGYEITVAPQHGALSGTAPMLKYTPEAGFTGMDAFTFTVTDDAGATSGAAEVNIEVTPPDCDGDRDVLVAFYQATNGDGWGENNGWLTSDDLANWHGVTAVDGCIVRIRLPENGLVGTIPWEFGELASLEWLDLDDNELTGPIPPELANLRSVERLNLAENRLSGGIPAEFGELASLELLRLDDNELTGPIPPELANLRSITDIDLGRNRLSGGIPVEFGELASLEWLDLDDNELTGPIPPELANLRSIKGIFLGDNRLSGGIPAEFGELASLESLWLQQNELTGPIPPELANLRSIKEISLAGNRLSGGIPAEFGELASLELLDLDRNELTGPIPPELANLRSVERLNLAENRLSGGIPAEFGELASLELLRLDDNELTGPIPPELANLRSITDIDLGRNRLSGGIPVEFGELASLLSLWLDDNELTGPIPPELANLRSIEWIILSGNRLSGGIPVEFGELASLLSLWLDDNELTGPIPPELANLRSVTDIDLGSNRLSGGIPVEFGELASLELLRLNHNELTGPIPPELARLTNLMWLSLHANQLAGPIPAVLGTLQDLRYLDLSDNQLTGSIPEELGELSSLAYLSLADNSLTGTIPLSLGQLPMDPSLVNGVLIGSRALHDDLRSGLLLGGNELSGPVPVELGNLTSAQILFLDRNRLTDPLPAELTGLTALSEFWFNDNNGLCAPADTGFQDWLQGIQDHLGPTCQ